MEGEDNAGSGERQDSARRDDGQDNGFLTIKEASAYCKISESNFYKLNRKGLVPKPVKIGTILRWRKSDLVAWVAAGCPRDWNGGQSYEQS